MRNFLKASAAVVIILGVALFSWRHLSGSDHDLRSAVEWAAGAGKPGPDRSAERRPEAVSHTVVKQVGMLLGQYRVVDEQPIAKPTFAVVLNKAAPASVPTRAAEAAAPNNPTPIAVPIEAAPAVVTNQAIAAPEEKSQVGAEGRSLSAGEEPHPSAKALGSQPAIAPTSVKAAPAETYTIAAGDTLSGIAAKLYRDPRQWRSIVRANPGLELRRLHPGQVIQLPRLQAASP